MKLRSEERRVGKECLALCALEGTPRILRLYGKGSIIHRDSSDYQDLVKRWFDGETPIGARQIVLLNFDLAQTSCGFGVPLFDYTGERESMDRWAEAKGENGIVDYWNEKNQESMDGLPTGLIKNDG